MVSFIKLKTYKLWLPTHLQLEELEGALSASIFIFIHVIISASAPNLKIYKFILNINLLINGII